MSSRNHTTGTGHFPKVPSVSMPRSTFDLTHGLKTTFNEGSLIPFSVMEVLPGDTFNLKPHFFARLATPLKPFMDNLFLDWQYFFVPNRLVWDNWQRFNGEQDNPDDSTDFIVPTLCAVDPGDQVFSFGVGNNVYDYAGLPTGADIANGTVQSLPFRGMNLIWNNFYRDQNYCDSLPVPKGDGPDPINTFLLENLVRLKRHDRFTSLLPRPQKGPTVQIPLGGHTLLNGVFGSGTVLRNSNAPAWNVYNEGTNTISGGGPLSTLGGHINNTGPNLSFDPVGGLSSTTGSSSGITVPLFGRIDDQIGTIPNLTTAFLIQNYLERNNRGGTRYIEYIKSQFGVTNPDFRLQIPELLSMGSMPINVNPVMQSSASQDDGTPQGNLAAFAVGSSHAKGGFSHSFTEHGFIIGFLSVRASYTYQQRMDKMWNRLSLHDYYVPALANLTEEPVFRKELQYIGLQHGDFNNGVLGYAERWSDYKTQMNRLTAFMKMQPTGSPIPSLSYWHLAEFLSEHDPVNINQGFLTENPPIERVVTITDEPHFLLDAHYELSVSRVMPTFNMPATLARF